MALAGVLLAACGGDSDPQGKKPGFFAGLFPGAPARAQARSTLIVNELVFFGVVAGDEPNAVKAAEDVLRFGGTAADAAVALALTMTVTMPSAVSLGGGGVCIVHDPTVKETEVIDFIAPPGTPDSGADRPSAVPALARGLAALHVRYGSLDMRGLLAAAEKKARFGQIVTRAMARDLALAAEPLFGDPAARRIFARPDGKPYREGDRLLQPDLAEIFSLLRTGGVGGLYKGPLAARLVKATRAAGGTLTLDDLRRYLPKWRKVVSIPYRDQVINFAPPPAGGGVGGSLMWNMLSGGDRYRKASGDGRMHLFLEAAKRAFAGRRQWLGPDAADDLSYPFADPRRADAAMVKFNPRTATPLSELDPAPMAQGENPAGAGFVVVDLVGQAVACTLTNYNLFGAGRVAPGTGIVLAAAPGKGNRNALSLGPVLVHEIKARKFRFAAAGSGGAAALTATMTVAATSVLLEAPLGRAIKAPRVHHGGLPDIALVEDTVPESVLGALRGRGHRLESVPALGRVNAVDCPLGLDAKSETVACFVFADPRGAGIAAEAER